MIFYYRTIMQLIIVRAILVIFIFTSFAQKSFACPRIGSLIDYNCDQKLKIVFIGDSIVYGRGDTAHADSGGYVFRLATKFPRAEIAKLGVPGITTGSMLRQIKDALASVSSNDIKNKLRDADVIILDIGRNDYWDEVRSSLAVNNLRRIITTINDWYIKNKKILPYSAVNTLLPLNPTKKTIRVKQLPYMSAFNINVIHLSNLKLLKILGRLDLLSKDTISLYDGIHPTSHSYDFITAHLFPRLRYLLATSLVKFRPDTDGDGVYDIAEARIFRTNPADADSDNDGFSDGYELFTSLTSARNGAEHP